MAIKVKVTNRLFEGVVAGVQFRKGEAIFEDEKMAERLAIQFGYELVNESKPAPKPKAPKPKAKAASKAAK